MSQPQVSLAPRMSDPSASVAPPLLPHVWAVSQYKYPINSSHLSLELVAEMLTKVQSIAANYAFLWTFIDRPPESSVFLAYIPNMQTNNPPNDGFAYMDAEQGFVIDSPIGQIQVYQHKYGFVPGIERMCNRVRRRYRLPNENLWLVHYFAGGDMVPSNPQQAAIVQRRRYPLPPLSSKPFKLSDPSTYIPVTLANVPVQTAPPHGQWRGQPPQKKSRMEDPDVGDELDRLTAREISVARYTRGHEWMEEILGSAYPSSKIIRPELGIETLTKEMMENKIKQLDDELSAMNEAHRFRVEAFTDQRSLLLKQAFTDLERSPFKNVQMCVEEELGLKINERKTLHAVPVPVEADGLSESLF